MFDCLHEVLIRGGSNKIGLHMGVLCLCSCWPWVVDERMYERECMS